MSPAPGHFAEELQDWLDGRLDPDRRAAVEAHLAGCPDCRRNLEGLRWVRDVALRHAPEVPVPPELVARVRSALDTEAATERRARPQVALHRVRWRLVTALAVTAASVALVLVARSRGEDPVSAAARDFRQVRDQQLALDLASSEPAAMEAYFTARGLTFPTRVFDLAMMQYRLVGGRLHRLRGRASALFVYRGPGNRALVCQMYLGRTTELAQPQEVRENDGIAFAVYREGPVTLVFWQEGDVICVLASDAPAEEVLQLAYAKAVKL